MSLVLSTHYLAILTTRKINDYYFDIIKPLNTELRMGAQEGSLTRIQLTFLLPKNGIFVLSVTFFTSELHCVELCHGLFGATSGICSPYGPTTIPLVITSAGDQLSTFFGKMFLILNSGCLNSRRKSSYNNQIV